MILGFDIGNTSTVMGLYRDDSPRPDETFRFDTDKRTSTSKLAGEIRRLLGPREGGNISEINGFSYSSVVPEINSVYDEAARLLFNLEAMGISHRSNLAITLRYKDLSQLGVDRIVNAESAFREYGAPCIIVDIGTAATFCVLLEGGIFDGGLIAPGINTTIKALSQYASNLPPVTFEKPDRLVAQDTVNAIKSGFFYGWISLVSGIITLIEKQYDMQFKIIFTGGLSALVAEHLNREIIIDRELTMKGIKYIYDLNRL